MSYFLNTITVPLLAYSGIEFLYGGDYYLRIAMQSLHKFVCIVSAVNGPGLKSLVFGLRLSVEVVAVNNKHHFVYIVQFGDELSSFE